MIRHRFIRNVAVVISWLALAGKANVRADEDPALQARYFEALRQRNLHTVAEDFATGRLRRIELPETARSQLILELAATLLDHGERVEPAQREELWGEAERALNSQLPKSAGATSLALRVELAMIPAARAEAACWHSRLDPEDQSLKLAARKEFDIAQTALRAALDLLLRSGDSERSPGRNGTAAIDENLLPLVRKVRLALARLQLAAAEISTGADQAARLIAAQEELREALAARAGPQESLAGKVMLARVLRRQQDLRQAQAVVEGIALTPADAVARDHVLAEKVLILCESGQTDQALKIVVERVRQAEFPSDEFRSAAVEVLLQAQRFALGKQQNELAAQLLNEAQVQAGNTSGKWGQLAFSRLSRAGEDAELGAELAAIIRQARGSYTRGDSAQAAELYAAAMKSAEQRGLTNRALEYGQTRGSLLLQLQDWPAAEAAFRDIVQRFSADPRAAEANLLRCYAVGKIEEAVGNKDERFEAALRDHISRFGSSPTRWEAAWMLSALHERREQFATAIAGYRTIPPDHPRYEAAQTRYVELYSRVLNDLAKSGADTTEWRSAAARDAAVVGGRLLDFSAAYSLDQCRTALGCASLLLRLQREQVTLASRLITRVQERIGLETRRVEAESGVLSSEWTSLELRTTRLALLALLHENKLPEAQRVLAKMDEDTGALLAFLGSLQEASQEIEPSQRPGFGSLMQSAIRRLERRRATLTPEQIRQLDESGVRAAIFVGDMGLASSLLQGLLLDSPGNKDLLKQLIDVSQRRGQVEDLRRARLCWIRLEQMEKGGSPEWIEARLSIAELHQRLSDRDAARNLLGATRAQYPEMGTPEFKARADKLWEQVK